MKNNLIFITFCYLYHTIIMKNRQFIVIVLLILISDLVIYYKIEYLKSDIELMWSDVITIANDTYKLSQIHE